jgi:hypothetical protein
MTIGDVAAIIMLSIIGVVVIFGLFVTCGYGGLALVLILVTLLLFGGGLFW